MVGEFIRKSLVTVCPQPAATVERWFCWHICTCRTCRVQWCGFALTHSVSVAVCIPQDRSQGAGLAALCLGALWGFKLGPPHAPDVCCNTLIRVVHQCTCLQLVEGPVSKVLAQEVGRHPLTPLQRQPGLRSTQAHNSAPLAATAGAPVACAGCICRSAAAQCAAC